MPCVVNFLGGLYDKKSFSSSQLMSLPREEKIEGSEEHSSSQREKFDGSQSWISTDETRRFVWNNRSPRFPQGCPPNCQLLEKVD